MRLSGALRAQNRRHALVKSFGRPGMGGCQHKRVACPSPHLEPREALLAGGDASVSYRDMRGRNASSVNQCPKLKHSLRNSSSASEPCQKKNVLSPWGHFAPVWEVSMKKLKMAGLATAACLFFASGANAATFFFDEGDMELAFAADGSISANFGRSGIGNGTADGGPEGAFTDIYNFTIDANGLASGSITTNTSILGSSTDLDLLSVFFNGVALTGTGVGLNEALFANSVPIFAGAQNTITINGFSRGNGSYGARGSFVPTAVVPEPATWAMMLIGFGAVGYSLRRRRPYKLVQAV